jgi:ABC transport system ATP-binding/permease protein
VRVLSGGERARLMLARALAKPSNLLVLDEPTNDLDLETLDLLQELLADYAGTVLLVSHDRDFLDRVVTSVLAPEGDGRWVEYAGGYSDMLTQRRGAELVKAAPQKATDDLGPAPAPPLGPPRSAKKMSFKDKHALETLPNEIQKLEKDIAALNVLLSDAGLYARNRAAFDSATGKLKAARLALETAELRWLDLEDRRAVLEN